MTTALLLLASLVSAAAPRTPLRPPFAISTTFPRVVPLRAEIMGRLAAQWQAAAPSVIPQQLPNGSFRLPQAAVPASPYAQAQPAPLAPVSARAQLEAAAPNAEQPGGGEQQAAQAGVQFDGSTPGGEGPAGPADPPSYLSVADPADRAWIADVVAVARGTKTGTAILDGIEKLAAEQQRPLTVVVASLRTNNGEYVYDWDVVRMNSAYRKLDPFSAAPIFMHELLHVLQKVKGYPTNALELELEAFVITLRMHQELGLAPKKGSFEAGAARALNKSAEAFVKYVGDAYTENRSLEKGGLRGYRAWVEKDLAKSKRAVDRLEKKLAKEKAVIEGMRASKQPEENIRAYEKDVVGELSRKLVDELTSLAWLERDLKLLDSPEDAARYRAYAARVRRMARAAQQRGLAQGL